MNINIQYFKQQKELRSLPVSHYTFWLFFQNCFSKFFFQNGISKVLFPKFCFNIFFLNFFFNIFSQFFFRTFFFSHLKIVFFCFKGFPAMSFSGCWLQIYNQKYKAQNARFNMATNISKN